MLIKGWILCAGLKQDQEICDWLSIPDGQHTEASTVMAKDGHTKSDGPITSVGPQHPHI